MICCEIGEVVAGEGKAGCRMKTLRSLIQQDLQYRMFQWVIQYTEKLLKVEWSISQMF